MLAAGCPILRQSAGRDASDETVLLGTRVGDEVVVLEPYYDSYVAMIQMAGGVRRPVTLRAPDFRLDPAELAGLLAQRRAVRANTLWRTTIHMVTARDAPNGS